MPRALLHASAWLLCWVVPPVAHDNWLLLKAAQASKGFQSADANLKAVSCNLSSLDICGSFFQCAQEYAPLSPTARWRQLCL